MRWVYSEVEVGLRTPKEALDERDEKTSPTEELLEMAEFMPKTNFFEFSTKIKQPTSGTAVETKSFPPYAYIFINDLKTKFLQGQHLQLLVWLRYVDDI